MAGFPGISKINGVAIANIANINGRAKGDVWEVSSAPRQQNLYKSLTDSSWDSFTLGTNYASFVAVGTSAGGLVYIAVSGHTSGDTYNFKFDKVGTTGARVFELRISENTNLLSTVGGGSFDAGLVSGSQDVNITASSTNTQLYMGFRQTGGSGTNTFTINNLIITRV